MLVKSETQNTPFGKLVSEKETRNVPTNNSDCEPITEIKQHLRYLSDCFQIKVCPRSNKSINCNIKVCYS